MFEKGHDLPIKTKPFYAPTLQFLHSTPLFHIHQNQSFLNALPFIVALPTATWWRFTEEVCCTVFLLNFGLSLVCKSGSIWLEISTIRSSALCLCPRFFVHFQKWVTTSHSASGLRARAETIVRMQCGTTEGKTCHACFISDKYFVLLWFWCFLICCIFWSRSS